MKKKQTLDQLREEWRRSRERAAEETERLSSTKPDLITPISCARWHEPPPARRPRKKWSRPSTGVVLNAIMIAMIGLMIGPILIILGAI